MIIKSMIKMLKFFVVIYIFKFFQSTKGRDTRTERSDIATEKEQYSDKTDRNIF